eukprot:TRINITY_DN62235_c0_g1_i1.p1 TRINITY_DN62235_c0_g1~~TRINITY_DN62235_c0_g1_i1.p1  ORF type:complete len:434 (+),score=74.59 TRINITY_DN62235_c0_g1_i1:76-1377(+)
MSCVAVPAMGPWAHMPGHQMPGSMFIAGQGATPSQAMQFICVPSLEVVQGNGVLPAPHGLASPMLQGTPREQVAPMRKDVKHRAASPGKGSPGKQSAPTHKVMNHQGTSSGTSSPVEHGSANRGSISQLQEFIQGAKIFPMPANCPVLQWDHDQRMVGNSLEFRATVAFLLDGVAHHTVGAWRASKKVAQRDAADRTLGLFVNRWASLLMLDESTGESEVEPLPEHSSDAQLLELFCQRLSSETSSPTTVHWSHKWEDEHCQAYVELCLLDVPYTFAGKPQSTQELAYEDVARRVLWYLQCPGYEDLFEPDPGYVKAVAQEIPKPAPCWFKDDGEDEDKMLAERRTTVMRVQNRVQQAYSQQLEPGKSVWFWSYEKEKGDDKVWPPRFKATVSIPLANRAFTGSWQRGQRDAQIDAAEQVSRFLDAEFPKMKG